MSQPFGQWSAISITIAAMLGYLVSAATYGLLLVACLTVWRRRLTGSGIAVAVGAQAGWSIAVAFELRGIPTARALAIAAEYVRDLAWALVLTRCLRRPAAQGAVRGLQLIGVVLIAVLILVIFGRWLPGHLTSLTRSITRYWLWGGLAVSIGGLILIEQVARNTRPAQRWALKYVWLTIGALYAWDLCLFSIAMLRGSAAQDFWIARGFVNALAGGLLAIGLRRITGWRTAAFLSPRVVFFNATLLAASMYVLAMAVGSFFVRRYGGSWGGAGQLLFLAAGVLVLAVAVLSEQFRAWSRVTVAKYFFPYRYDYRSEWQKLTRALSASSDVPLYDRVARVMAGFVSSASGGLWLEDAEGAYVPAGGELAPADAPREAECREFFDFLLRNEWVCDLDEARNPRPDRRASPAPPEWMLASPRMWLVVPLICESALVGFVVIGQPLANVQLSWEELDLLKAAGRQVGSFLAFERAAKRLAEAHQFEAINKLSAVLMHDLRHLIAQQALVVENAARHRDNPEFFDDAILTIDNSVKRMTRLMEELRGGAATEETHRTELNEACAEAVRRCAGGEPVPTRQARDRSVEVIVNRERLLQVLEHVIRNAQQATPPDGSVTVFVGRVAPHAVIEVADTGCGMDPQFIRDRLFRPFDSTKGDQGFGMGAYQAREFARQCGGGVEVESAPGKGTRFIIRLPLAPALVAAVSGRGHERQAN